MAHLIEITIKNVEVVQSIAKKRTKFMEIIVIVCTTRDKEISHLHETKIGLKTLFHIIQWKYYVYVKF